MLAFVTVTYVVTYVTEIVYYGNVQCRKIEELRALLVGVNFLLKLTKTIKNILNVLKLIFAKATFLLFI